MSEAENLMLSFISSSSNSYCRLDFQKYGEAMKKLSLTIMGILGRSLEVDGSYYKEYFEEGRSIMRCNFYPPCQEPGKTLGTGPHCDPTALTILYQDQVGGLEVFADGQWKSVKPRPDALVINLGDTFSVSHMYMREYFF